MQDQDRARKEPVQPEPTPADSAPSKPEPQAGKKLVNPAATPGTGMLPDEESDEATGISS
jgi:hypothetical protein